MTFGRSPGGPTPKGIRQYPSPPISPGQGLPAAVSHEDKCNALRSALFQPPPPIHAEPTDLVQDHPDDLTWEPVSYAEVRRAIFAPNQHKAPGPSQINYMVLRWAWAADPVPIYLLISRCANVGYHPQIWRKTVAVALCKPKKPDYSNPRAYRLIQLEECLGKVLESVIARRLSLSYPYFSQSQLQSNLGPPDLSLGIDATPDLVRPSPAP